MNQPTGLITMSQQEVDRLQVILQVTNKELSQRAGGKLLGLSTRQVRRLQQRYQKKGADGLVSKRRGQPSNHRLDSVLVEKARQLIGAHYRDFGPTLACEKLLTCHGLKLSIESTRQLMLKAGFWKGKRRKKARIHQSRPRRSQLGELVQIDGSPHDWFEGRGERCCLLVFIDDATSRLMQLLFVPSETLEGYFKATESYLKAHGRPIAYYSDKHGIFRVNAKEAKSGTGETQFGRAMRELGIELICANTPQAKGRVEKVNRTLQDRLVKEMRLRGICHIEEANRFLPEFISVYNKRFAVEAASDVDAHRDSLPNDDVLALIFSEQHQRQVSKNLEISYKNVLYQIQTHSPSYAMRKASVTVCDRKGEITLLYKGQKLLYKTIDKKNRPAKVLTAKELQPIKKGNAQKPAADHPWRQYEKVKQRKAVRPKARQTA